MIICVALCYVALHLHQGISTRGAFISLSFSRFLSLKLVFNWEKLNFVATHPSSGRSRGVPGVPLNPLLLFLLLLAIGFFWLSEQFIEVTVQHHMHVAITAAREEV